MSGILLHLHIQALIVLVLQEQQHLENSRDWHQITHRSQIDPFEINFYKEFHFVQDLVELKKVSIDSELIA